MATMTPTRPPTINNLPNQLTVARLLLAMVLFVLIGWQNWIACVLVFAVAAFTDWLDGYLARRQNLATSLGRNLDPLVDKVLICGAYIFLLPLGNPARGLLHVRPDRDARVHRVARPRIGLRVAKEGPPMDVVTKDRP